PMTSDLDTRRSSDGDRARARAYTREFVPAMAAYAVVLVAVVTFGDLDGDSPWRFLWALLPVLPVLAVARAVARSLRRSDEYARLVQLRALAAGSAVAMVACVVLGMLGAAGLVLAAAPWLAFGAGMLTWALVAAAGHR
ncbi:hypothetical protein GTR00_16455, partial [Kineococcus sp. T90]